MGLLDPKFKYVPSGSTDIRKTFERERKRLKKLEDAKVIEPPVVIPEFLQPLKRVK